MIIRLLLLFLLAATAGAVMGCRGYSRVERHFLRVPALAAGEVSAIDRQKWLKKIRKHPGRRQQAKESHYLFLDAATRPAGLNAPEGEVQFFPDSPGSRTGMIALSWMEEPGNPGSARLRLLQTEGGRYQPLPPSRSVPENTGMTGFSLSAEPGAITGYRRMEGTRAGPAWRKAGSWRWRQGRWVMDEVNR